MGVSIGSLDCSQGILTEQIYEWNKVAEIMDELDGSHQNITRSAT